MTNVSNKLPPEFASLEPFAGWALPTEREQFPLDAMPEDALRLLYVCYSLINASFPVEAWRQPRVPDSGASTLEVIIEPAV